MAAPRVHDVVIVGAGMAGLACARALAGGVGDVLVVEARDRVGGRVHTDRALAPGHALELGAFYVHGRRVITHRLLREFDLARRSVPVIWRARFSHHRRVVRFPAGLHPLNPAYGFAAFVEALVTLPREIEAYRGRDLTLGEFLDRRRPRIGARQFTEVLTAHAAAAELGEIGVLGPAEESRLASERFGFSNFQVLGGYDLLAQRMARDLGDRVRLNTTVDRVEWRAGAADLACRGPGGEETLAARRVVLTLPLGVLRAGAVAFEPPLPPEKLRAIAAVAMGQALVVQLRLQGSKLVERLGDFAILWGGGPSSFHRTLSGLPPLPGGRDVVHVFTVGREAVRRAGLPEADLANASLEELRALLPPRLDMGALEAFRVARWPNDPLTLGAYSFLPPGVGVAQRKALAAPVGGTLFFAGEATHHGGEAGTVHGAIETGLRAAAEVLASLASSPGA